jgi:DNA-binding CsgD family transcriptional regulator
MSVTIAYAPEVGAPGAIPAARLDDRLAGMPIDALLREVIARASALDPEGEPSLVVTVDGVRCALTPVQPTPADGLSPREREIACMVARGYTNKMIASVLDISLWTVSTHLRRIFAKLGVSTRAAMVALVVDR